MPRCARTHTPRYSSLHRRALHQQPIEDPAGPLDSLRPVGGGEKPAATKRERLSVAVEGHQVRGRD